MNLLGNRNVFIVVGAVILVVAASFCIPAKERKGNGGIMLQFVNCIGDSLVRLDSSLYKNSYGQDYSINRIRYYIGNIKLYTKDGKEGYASHEYFLIDEDGSSPNTCYLDVDPLKNYTSISFIIGVDSIHNCSGTQSGALDPVHGMFWAWNTGYVFFKMDGKASSSKSSGNMLEFHIGGYKYPNNCIREVSLNLNDNDIHIMHDGYGIIVIKADIGKVFNSVNKIDFSKISTVTDFHNATTIADNYKDMFSILKIKDEK